MYTEGEHPKPSEAIWRGREGLAGAGELTVMPGLRASAVNLETGIPKEGRVQVYEREVCALTSKFAELKRAIARRAEYGVAVALTGDCSSALVLAAAAAVSRNAHAITVVSHFKPGVDAERCRGIAQRLGAAFHEIAHDEFSDPGIAACGGRERCLGCKRAQVAALRQCADRFGLKLLLFGVDDSDREQFRAQDLALLEAGAECPLCDCGISRPEAAALCRELGLNPLQAKPSCLALGADPGIPVTPEALRDIADAEAALESLGYREPRVFLLHGTARIALDGHDIARAALGRREIAAALEDFQFSTISIDIGENT